MHLLRTGEEEEARRALERSFNIDSFHRVTYNLLMMLDKLEKFTVVDAAVVPTSDGMPWELGKETANALHRQTCGVVLLAAKQCVVAAERLLPIGEHSRRQVDDEFPTYCDFHVLPVKTLSSRPFTTDS